MNVRALTYSNRIVKFIIEIANPYLGDLNANTVSARYVGAERVEFLPVPLRSTKGTMPFNPEQGITKNDSRVRRAKAGIALLIVGGYFSYMGWNETRMVGTQILSMPVYLVWLLEGCRRANHLKPIQW